MRRFAPTLLLGLVVVALLVPGVPSRGSASDELPRCDSVPPPPQAPDFPPPVAGDVSLKLVGQVGGEVGPLALRQERLYVGVGQRIAVLDLARPRAPRTVAFSEPLPAPVEDLVASGTVLGAAAGDAGLFLFDIAVPDELRKIASLDSPGYAHAIALARGRALLADGPGGLRIVDVGDPARPSELAAAFELHNVLGVAAEGTHAFLAAADEGLLVVDVTDPGAPVEAGAIHTGGFANRITVGSGIAYLADAWGGLRTIDVTTPASPVRLGGMRTSSWAMDVAVTGTRAYMAAGSDGLRVLDVSHAARPKKLGAIRLPRGHAADVAVRGGVAYLSDTSAGLHVIDVSTPTSPVTVRLVDPLGPALAVALRGDHAFVAADTLGLKVIDVSDPTHPREVGGVRAPGPADGVAVAGSNVFLTTREGPGVPVPAIHGIDASDPTRPAIEASHQVAGRDPDTGETRPGAARGIAVQDGILYIANEHGMVVIDGRRSSPCEVSFLPTGSFVGGTDGVSAAGSTAYLGRSSGLLAVDASDLRRPRLVSTTQPDLQWPLAVGAALYGTASGGAHRVVAGQDLHTFDVSQPTSPRHVATLGLPSGPDFGATSPLAYAGGKLFVAGGPGGLFVVDVSQLESPRLAGRIRLGGPAVGVAADDRHAYVATGSGGLSIVEWASLAPSTEMTSSKTGSARTADRTVTTARSSTGSAPRCTVTSRADDGPNTLRGCVGRVGKGGIVRFDPSAFPPGEPGRIRLESQLGGLRRVTIDGRGTGVILDGGGTVGEGLTLLGRVTIRGLRIEGFGRNGILISGSRNTVSGSVLTGNETGIQINRNFASRPRKNRIIGNFIGIDPDGTLPRVPQGTGVWIDSGNNNVVGGARARERNVISGHSRIEILISHAGSRNSIVGNYIGTDPSGTELRRHPDNFQAIGVDLFSNRNRIADNVIGGGIGIGDRGSSYNSVVGNRIGVGATGQSLGCRESSCGVGSGTRFNRFGGSRPGEGNVIDGGLVISTSDNVFLGNRLMATEGNPAINLGGSERNTVGGRSPQGRNEIEGGPILIWRESRFNTVIGNTIGDGGTPPVNAVTIAASGNNFVVANEITGFTQTGILLHDGAFANSVRGNFVDGDGAGIRAFVSEGNVIVGNAFLHVPVNAADGGELNLWDDGARGNFWADYPGMDTDGDGIGNTPYPVNPNGVDHFPLMAPPLR